MHHPALLLLVALASPSACLALTVQSFPMPSSLTYPVQILADSAGNLLLVGSNSTSSSIVKLTQAGEVIYNVQLPNTATCMVLQNDDTLWVGSQFLYSDPNMLYKVNATNGQTLQTIAGPTGMPTSFPAVNYFATGDLAFDHEGDLWALRVQYTAYGNQMLAVQVNPQTSAVISNIDVTDYAVSEYTSSLLIDTEDRVTVAGDNFAKYSRSGSLLLELSADTLALNYLGSYIPQIPFLATDSLGNLYGTPGFQSGIIKVNSSLQFQYLNSAVTCDYIFINNDDTLYNVHSTISNSSGSFLTPRTTSSGWGRRINPSWSSTRLARRACKSRTASQQRLLI